MSLVVIDIVFIVVILILGFVGLKKGFFSQTITFGGLVAGLFLAYFFSDDLAPFLSNIFGEKSWITLVSFILIFVVSVSLAALTNKIFSSSLQRLGAENVDKVLGFCFGIVVGIFVCIGLTALLTVQPFIDPEPIFRDSVLAAKFLNVLPQLDKFLPESSTIFENLNLAV